MPKCLLRRILVSMLEATPHPTVIPRPNPRRLSVASGDTLRRRTAARYLSLERDPQRRRWNPASAAARPARIASPRPPHHRSPLESFQPHSANCLYARESSWSSRGTGGEEGPVTALLALHVEDRLHSVSGVGARSFVITGPRRASGPHCPSDRRNTQLGIASRLRGRLRSRAPQQSPYAPSSIVGTSSPISPASLDTPGPRRPTDPNFAPEEVDERLDRSRLEQCFSISLRVRGLGRPHTTCSPIPTHPLNPKEPPTSPHPAADDLSSMNDK